MIKMLLPAALLLAPLSTAHAGGNAGQALAAGGTSFGLELAGGAAGGIAGIAIGVRSCEEPEEDKGAPGCGIAGIAGGVLGLGLGATAGGLGGAALGGNLVGARPGRTLGFAAIGLGTGIAVSAIPSNATRPLGTTLLVLGMPIGAGIAVATDDSVPRPRTSRLQLSPAVVGGQRGLVLKGRF